MEIHQFLRTQFEPLQYVAFFGMLLVLGLAEALIPQRGGPIARRARWPANFILTALNIVIISAMPVNGLFAADWAAAKSYGLLPFVGIGGAAAIALGVLARSFSSWAMHLAMHKIPLLWRVHRVHHTDDFFDISTTVRFHPVEFLISVPIALAVIVGLGIPPLAIILYELLDAAMAVWTHANIRLPRWLDRGLKLLFVTPDMHRIHHSTYQPETDSNYGATLSVWDRLFGTYVGEPVVALSDMRLGLNECRDSRTYSLFWLLKLPFIRHLALGRQGRQS
jgi:sterol desaturase/sphingolipid hydroxylase (fatty acid hydroxylase superfamily)